ncbi:MAG: 23S rRNA (adenine(2503)-C(2))-methyltransferase RlmN [Clostridia bacterium]
MKILTDYNLQGLEEVLSEYNIPSYKVKQIAVWLAKGYEFNDMSTLDKQLRTTLDSNFYAQGAKILQKFISRDGTIKYLFSLTDGNVVEGVFMRYNYGNTLCISTQVGCRMGCSFCASTLKGLIRNCSVGEMVSFVTLVNLDNGGTIEKRSVTNLVLMGSGEPLDNFDNVVAFLSAINSKDGLNISYRNISLSTCGIVPNIYALADLKLGVNLTISLHSAYQEKREEIMPIAKQYNLTELIEASKYYFTTTGRRVIFEYTLIDGVNDGLDDAYQLAQLTRGFSHHINLIRLNPVAERKHRPTNDQHAKYFLTKLTEFGCSATLRRQLGVDIAGACGQLRQSYLEQKVSKPIDKPIDNK